MQSVFEKNRKGFTLVELLATIVILGVLLLIAVPSINGVINRSKQEVLLTDAEMYLNATKLQMALLGNDKKIYIFEIEDIETEKGNNNYLGQIMAIKNKTTGKYEYSIFMVNSDTNEALGKLEGTTPTFVDEITKENISKVDKVLYEKYSEDYGKGLTSFYIDGENGKEKKRVTSTGELYDLKNSMIDTTVVKQLYVETQEYGRLYFYILNDEGDRLLLLLNPFPYTETIMKYADSDVNGESDIQTYMKKYSELNLLNKEGKYVKENLYVRLLTDFDLYQLYGGTDSSMEGITKLFKEKKNSLTGLFYGTTSYAKSTYSMGSPQYTPTLIINTIDEIYEKEGCNIRGELTSESDAAGTECYGLNMVQAAFSEGKFITPHSGNFFVRLVLQVEGNQREYFVDGANRLENFYE